MPALPVPTLDHVVVNLRDRLDDGLETFRRLGFTMTPRGHHTLGSINHLAVFGTEYLELLAVPEGETRRPEILSSPVGLGGLVFGTEDAAALHLALDAAGVPVYPPVEFSRPVQLAEGTQEATFRAVNIRMDALEPAIGNPGRLYFCHHLTRSLVWRDGWRRHPNGVTGISRVVIAAREPQTLGTLFARMFGATAVRSTADGCSVLAGLARIDLVTPAAVEAAFGAFASADADRTSYMAALTLRTRSLDKAAAAMMAGGVEFCRESDRLLVAAECACGVTLEYQR